MGLLKPDDWRAVWIGRVADVDTLLAPRPAPMFRKIFKIPSKVVMARAYISVLGYYEMHVNGTPCRG